MVQLQSFDAYPTASLQPVQTQDGYFQAIEFIPNTADYVAVLQDEVGNYYASDFPYYILGLFWNSLPENAKAFVVPIPFSFLKSISNSASGENGIDIPGLLNKYKGVCRREKLRQDILFKSDYTINPFLEGAALSTIQSLFA